MSRLFGAILKTGDHAERRRLATAGRPQEGEAFAFPYLKVEVINGNNAFVCDLQLVALFLCRFFSLLLFLLRLLCFGVRINLLDVFQYYC